MWFQNRRTKHKRQKDEDGNSDGVSHCSALDHRSSSDPRISHSDSEEEEDEELDQERRCQPPNVYRSHHNNSDTNTDLRTTPSLDGDESVKSKQASSCGSGSRIC